MANEKDKKHSKKANEAYDDISEAGFDLKALIAASKSALAAKQANNQKKKKNAKKTLMQAAQEKIKLQAQQIAAMEKQVVVVQHDNRDTAKNLTQDKVDDKKGRGFLYGGRAQQFLACKKALDSAEMKILEATAFKLFTKVVEDSIAKDLAKASRGGIYFSPNAGKAKAEYNKRIGIANHALGKLRAANKSLPAAPTNSPLNPTAPAAPSTTQTSSPQKMLDFFNGSQPAGNRMSPLGSALSSAGQGVTRPTGFFGQPTVTALNKVSDAVEKESETISNLTKDSEAWLGKKLSFLGSTLRRLIPRADGGKAGLLGNLFGLAMLIPSLIAPALEGINAALEEKFGKHYVRDFLVGLWDKSLAFLSDKIKDILGIKDKGKENMPRYKELTRDDGPHTREQELNIQYRHEAPKKPSIFGEEPQAPSSPALNAIRWTMAQQKGDAKGAVAVGGIGGNKGTLQTMVDNAPPGTIDGKTAKELQAMGVTVPATATGPAPPMIAVPGSNDTRGGSAGTSGMTPNITGGGVKLSTTPDVMTPAQMGVYEMRAHGAR